MADVVGRRVRVTLEEPNGRPVDCIVSERPLFNADAAAPLTVLIETECPCCLSWVKMQSTPINCWGPDHA